MTTGRIPRERWPEPERPTVRSAGPDAVDRLAALAWLAASVLALAGEAVRAAWRRWRDPRPLWRGRR